ncbi:hypothetical protein HU200_041030 [Digitaria exilis]|uniref:Glycosyltransferase n=1 Tax=Digitaria exilis TaxID=1010633 RepID=A0A835BDF0_9POAL|nr:hypothetical protein HU200_041030 [Digitaria exilis]
MAGDKQQQQQEQSLHLVVFPWLAFGHLIPFLELSKRLAARGHAVTFVSTARNIARLPPEGLSGRVRMVALPLPAVDGLPEGAESTADVPPEKVELLKAAFDGLAAPFADFLAAACAGDREEEEGVFGRKPDWIVLDFAHYWLCPIADEHQVPCAMFLIFTAAWVVYCGSREENINHPRVTVDDFMPMPRWFPSPPSLTFRRHEAAWIAASFRPNASGVSDIDRFWQTEQRCRLLLVRSCPELEPRLFPLISDVFRKPAVVPTGFLLPEDKPTTDATRSGAVRWLDEQPPRSVLYVALGSEAPVTAENVRELAAGLELSGERFLWALRPPSGAGGGGGDGAAAVAMLPEGFEARTRGRGVVCAGWVPQVRVLGHVAVGAFLTHCGWGSVTESLGFGGHPLVMLPFITDQGLIARMMAERGVGVEVARRDDDEGWFGRDDVAAAVRRVMVEERKGLAHNARSLQRLVLGDDGGREERDVDEVVECFRRHSSFFTEESL